MTEVDCKFIHFRSKARRRRAGVVMGQVTKTIVQGHKENFETLRRAFECGDVALLECEEIATGEKVAVICCAQEQNDGTVEFVPFARFFNGNPYSMLRPPNPDGGFFVEDPADGD